ncbi:MAG: hypothetical protein ACK5H1_01025 [Tenacibaculum sp.]
MKKILILSILLFYISLSVNSQGNASYTGGYKIKFNESGSKYLRIIAWGQFWANYNSKVNGNTAKLNLSVRRARILSFTQLNSKFLLLTHFGLNSLSGANQSPLGKDEGSQLFFHGFYGQWSIYDQISVGAGLHYWNGISRLNNQSTLNMLSLDNNRQSWATLGLSDQFARHIGVYIKGKIKKLQYRLAVNEAGKNTIDNRDPTTTGLTVYAGRQILGSAKAGKVFQGYFDYNFLDQESNLLPYKVGTYLGSKKIFNIGAGFFSHPNGVVKANGKGDNVNIFAIDAFYDAPLSEKGSALTAYGVFQSNNYGENYNYNAYASGLMLYGHLGYLISGQKDKTRFQPYVSLQTRSIKATNSNASKLGIGTNIFMTGHHSKLTVEYSRAKESDKSLNNTLTLQAMIYL